MNTNENKHMIFARIQQALAKQGVYTTLALHVGSPEFSALGFKFNCTIKTIFSTDYTEESLLAAWSKIEKEGVDALCNLEKSS